MGLVAQRLEQRTHNPLVPGSNPGGPTKAQRYSIIYTTCRVKRTNGPLSAGPESPSAAFIRRLAELLRLNHLNPVYHGEHGLRSLKELVRSYLTITKDL